MRSACIDIGSNTTRLLVAELDGDQLREVLAQRVFTRLRGFDGAIPADRIGELAEVVANQARLATEAGAEQVRAVATAAIRGAPNRDELCAAIEAASGVKICVLSGKDEARLAFLGATRTLRHDAEERVAVVDVGGGSTEIVCGTAARGVEWSASVLVGSGLLADTYVRSDPPEADELERIADHAAAAFEVLDAPRPVAGYAVGGSATSMRRLIGAVLDHDTIRSAIGLVCAEPSEAVARRLDLHLERVRVLPAGMLLLDAASAFLEVPLQIAGGGLREGVILEELGAHSW